MKWPLFFVLLFIMTFSGTLGALFFKKAMGQLDGFNVIRIVMNRSLYIGGFFYMLGAAVNIFILRYGDYTTVYPLTSFTYVWSMLIALFVLKERIDYNKIIALICIITGAFLIYF
jgi:drug/metabolite transporter (DMT)-like permease